ncbi:hypothetical protein GOP47_0009533 [Adiantum capillus-veneris]|uniref:Myb-like domain-containing protein n=1 Tax=Adiantum capillus-veneris TaxID=13818 RepID=A0A9D4ZIT2_ADICA|nr:hypothetical protein GOP47_0009533 [Adiantum capillus-veneris]
MCLHSPKPSPWQFSTGTDRKLEMKRLVGKGPPPLRLPRSTWTVQEILCLVDAKKENVEENEVGVQWLMQGSAHRVPFSKWQAVASACSAKCGARKTQNQCFLKWRRLLKPWRAIFIAGPDRYWVMSREERKASCLPLSFNRRVFIAILHAFQSSGDTKLLLKPRDHRGETKSSTVKIVEDTEELPNAKIDKKEELQILQKKLEKERPSANRRRATSSPQPGFSQHEVHHERTSLGTTNHVQEDANHLSQIVHERSPHKDPVQSKVAEASQSPTASPDNNNQHTEPASHDNVEENIPMEENGAQDCSESLNLDKETIIKFLESINSMAKVMESIVKALTR